MGNDQTDIPRDSQFLRGLWNQLNEEFFGSQLVLRGGVGWMELHAGEVGRYYPLTGMILIRAEFEDLETETVQIGERVKAQPGSVDPLRVEEVAARTGFVLGVLLHEMVHQATHELDRAADTGHGDSFIARANRVAALATDRLPPCDAVNAANWPNVDGKAID
jgi:hypothetical protein